jgi:carbon storage regulator
MRDRSLNEKTEFFMLILTRRLGEKLMIGEEVLVTVLDIKGDQVRIGIKAPLDIAVHRLEIFERIERQKNRGSPDNEILVGS